MTELVLVQPGAPNSIHFFLDSEGCIIFIGKNYASNGVCHIDPASCGHPVGFVINECLHTGEWLPKGYQLVHYNAEKPEHLQWASTWYWNPSDLQFERGEVCCDPTGSGIGYHWTIWSLAGKDVESLVQQADAQVAYSQAMDAIYRRRIYN